MSWQLRTEYSSKEIDGFRYYAIGIVEISNNIINTLRLNGLLSFWGFHVLPDCSFSTFNKSKTFQHFRLDVQNKYLPCF